MKYFVSGADREGEGEFKVFEHLSHLEAIHNDPTVDLPNSAEPTDTYLVIGLCVLLMQRNATGKFKTALLQGFRFDIVISTTQ